MKSTYKSAILTPILLLLILADMSAQCSKNWVKKKCIAKI